MNDLQNCDAVNRGASSVAENASDTDSSGCCCRRFARRLAHRLEILFQPFRTTQRQLDCLSTLPASSSRLPKDSAWFPLFYDTKHQLKVCFAKFSSLANFSQKQRQLFEFFSRVWSPNKSDTVEHRCEHSLDAWLMFYCSSDDLKFRRKVRIRTIQKANIKSLWKKTLEDTRNHSPFATQAVVSHFKMLVDLALIYCHQIQLTAENSRLKILKQSRVVSCMCMRAKYALVLVIELGKTVGIKSR